MRASKLVITIKNLTYKDNVSKWALDNNLRLNKAKCVEIVFTDIRCKLQICQPPQFRTFNVLCNQSVWALLSLTACPSVKLLNTYIQSVISKFAQSMHAIKILRSHGMSSDALKVIYKSVVLTKLLYASPAWWGFATSVS